MCSVRYMLSFCAMLCCARALVCAQSTVQGPGARIEILNSDRLEYGPWSKAQRLIGNVRLKHENALMRCDSAYLFEDQTMNAFGNVAIDQDTVHITADRLDYIGKDRLATLKGNVHLTDPGMELTTDLLTYSLRERVARYSTGATIVSRREQNTLTSRNGAYLAGARRFIFSDSVKLRHPERTIDADTLHYTTSNGIAEFFGPTRITQGTMVMFTERGSYDTRAEQGRFTRSGRIVDGAQELRGDSLHYDKRSGEGRAWGNVAVIDTTNDLLVRGDAGRHTQDPDSSFITGHAELVMMMGEDTLFLHADTLFAKNDTILGRRILARRNVRLFKNNMQGVCDTMTYADRDSLITLVGEPFLWSGAETAPDDTSGPRAAQGGSQISGRTIRISLRDGRAHRLYVLRDALLANSVDTLLTDTERAYFDQVTGTNITGFFSNDELVRLETDGNSRTVSFAKEKNPDGIEVVTTMNRADCSRIVVGLDSGQVSTITFLTKPDAVMYPLAKAPVEEMRMKGFVWNAAARPTDRKSIFAPAE